MIKPDKVKNFIEIMCNNVLPVVSHSMVIGNGGKHNTCYIQYNEE